MSSFLIRLQIPVFNKIIMHIRSIETENCNVFKNRLIFFDNLKNNKFIKNSCKILSNHILKILAK